MYIDDIRTLVRDRLANRPVILAGADLDRLAQHVGELRAIGAERVLVVTSGRGAGAQPDLSGYQYLQVHLRAGDSVGAKGRAWEALFANPPAEVQQVIDAFDPGREAVVIPWRFRRAQWLGVRPVYGPRLPDAVAIEDKTKIGKFLAELGIPQPPDAITIEIESPDLGAAMRHVDRGHGSVWSGDARSGTNSGAKFVRWVRDMADAGEAYRFFSERCHEVRVAPFLEGIPCGMHGFVTPKGTAAFRPVELLVLRRAGDSAFVDAGFGTTFDPAPEDTGAYRDIVRSIGDGLYETFGYQGCISVDAVLTEDGWKVHDVNPRQGGGLVYLQASLPTLPMHLLHHVAAAGDAGDIDPQRLESEVNAAADATRMVRAALKLDVGPTEELTCAVRMPGDESMELSYRPRGSSGGRLEIDAHVQPGEPVAPKIVNALHHIGKNLGVDFTVFAAAQDRRPAARVHESLASEAPSVEMGDSPSRDGVTPSL